MGGRRVMRVEGEWRTYFDYIWAILVRGREPDLRVWNCFRKEGNLALLATPVTLLRSGRMLY